jgi:hypothetical protein
MDTQAVELEPSDYPQGWYHVYVDYAEGHKPAVVDIAKLAGLLPHGSGIDGNWRIQVRRNGDVTCHGEYHAMDDGGYTGWHNFRFTLAHCTRNEYKGLMGPCAGMWQVARIKGQVYFGAFVGGGENRDYLYDTCYWPMADGMDIHTSESGITVSSEQQARMYTK